MSDGVTACSNLCQISAAKKKTPPSVLLPSRPKEKIERKKKESSKASREERGPEIGKK